MRHRGIIKEKTVMWSKIQEMRTQGMSKSKIARELGINRETVSSYLSMDENHYHSWIERLRTRPKVLEPYRDKVAELLRKDRSLSSPAICDRLKELNDDFPYICEKTMYNFVKSVREQEGLPKEKSCRQYEMLEETAYGEYAQVDFGQHWMPMQDGKRIQIYFMVMILCRSRAKYVYFSDRPFTSEKAVEAHGKAFEYFGGQPRRIIYDQDTVFLNDENLGDYNLPADFMSYVAQMDFKVIFCRPRDPESKGKVENAVKYVKYNFLKAREYRGLEALQEEGIAWLERTGNGKVHCITGKAPIEELAEERKHLQPLIPYQKAEKRSDLPIRMVIKTNLFKYEGNEYSVPTGTYQGRDTRVTIADDGNTLTVMDKNGTVIAVHSKPHGKGVTIRDKSHLRDRNAVSERLAEEVKAAFKDKKQLELFIEETGRTHARYLADNLRIIKRNLDKYTEEVWNQALRYCLDNNRHNANDLLRVCERYSRKMNAQEKRKACQTVQPECKAAQQDLIPAASQISTYEQIIR